jgi:hypothetical protein
MNVQHQLTRIGAGMHDLGTDLLTGEVDHVHAAMRLAELADIAADLAEYLRPERRRLTGLRRWWFLARRRSIV